MPQRKNRLVPGLFAFCLIGQSGSSFAQMLGQNFGPIPSPGDGPSMALRPDQVAFLGLYKELIETNTTLSSGSCTEAAGRMAARLKTAGFPDEDVIPFVDPAHPKEGGLVAILPGRDASAGAILLLAHLDVVEARRADWTRDPFKLVEDYGYYYGRGTRDDKAQAATWTDILVRFRRQGYVPRRTVKMALTCGEETTTAFNGAEWLAHNRPQLIAADFALNEGGGGKARADGTTEIVTIQAGEKAVQNFRLEATNPGGHSSRPRPDNAIYALAAGLLKIRDTRFPVRLNDASRAYLGSLEGRQDQDGEMKAAIGRLLADPADAGAAAIVSRDPDLNSMIRTTCVATLLDGGHANNALPQRAGANINCRVIPGETYDTTEQRLIQALDDPALTLARVPPNRPVALPVRLDPRVVAPAERLARQYFPGAAFTPTMVAGGTDAVFIAPAGIPVYGVPGMPQEPDGGGVHGLNERIRVEALYRMRDYLTDLVRAYAEQP